MGTGHLPDDVLAKLVEAVRDVPGDFAEIGVWQGQTFRRLVVAARDQGKVAHGFDSFVGMAEPGRFDGPRYHAGRFGVGGVDVFRCKYMKHVDDQSFHLWAGFVPACFDGCDARFSLVYVDLDHHDPTEAAITWAWPRIEPGGILACDDYFPGAKGGASPPVDRLRGRERLDVFHEGNNQIALVKPAEGAACA